MPNPIPQNLPRQANKAASVIEAFTRLTGTHGPEKYLIPRHVLNKCRGIAVISVIRAGWFCAIRGGSGVVVAKKQNGEWSCPAAVSLIGISGGLTFGMELTNFILILNTEDAVRAFCGGNVTLGANVSVAAGPLGRSAEADVAVKHLAAVYTYSKSRGLFAGVSLEGAGVFINDSTNKKFYGRSVSATEILTTNVVGSMKIFPEFTRLFNALENGRNTSAAISSLLLNNSPGYGGRSSTPTIVKPFRTSSYRNDSKVKRQSTVSSVGVAVKSDRYDTATRSGSAGPHLPSYSAVMNGSAKSNAYVNEARQGAMGYQAGGRNGTGDGQIDYRDHWQEKVPAGAASRTFQPAFTTQPPLYGSDTDSNANIYPSFASTGQANAYPSMGVTGQANVAQHSPSMFNAPPRPKWDGMALEMAQALYDFNETQPGDLALRTGDKVMVLDRDKGQWWLGRNLTTGNCGVFPASYVTSVTASN